MFLVEVRPHLNLAPGEPGADLWAPLVHQEQSPSVATFNTEAAAEAYLHGIQFSLWREGFDNVGEREYRITNLNP
jgi:hypothetical protein